MDVIDELGIKADNLSDKWQYLESMGNEKAWQEDIKHSVKSNIESNIRLYLKNEPVLGATTWFLTKIIFLSGNQIAARFEDGHIYDFAVFKYDEDSGLLSLIVESLSQ